MNVGACCKLSFSSVAEPTVVCYRRVSLNGAVRVQIGIPIRLNLNVVINRQAQQRVQRRWCGRTTLPLFVREGYAQRKQLKVKTVKDNELGTALPLFRKQLGSSFSLLDLLCLNRFG